jgi:hypothetical protein
MFALNLGTTFAISKHNSKKDIRRGKMNVPNERRVYKRCRYQTSVICAYFNSDRFYHAKTTNHSREGINFVSDFPLKTGANIYVRVDYDSHDDHRSGICDCGKVRQIGLAKVKWCREISGDYGSFYNIGLKYKEPAV